MILVSVSACIVSVRGGCGLNALFFNRLNYDPILFVCLLVHYFVLFVCFIVSGSHLRFVSCLLFVSVVVCWLVGWFVLTDTQNRHRKK